MMLSDVCRVHPVGGQRVRPAGWMARIGWSGPAGLAQGCRCRLPLQVSAGAYRGGWRPTYSFSRLSTTALHLPIRCRLEMAVTLGFRRSSLNNLIHWCMGGLMRLVLSFENGQSPEKNFFCLQQLSMQKAKSTISYAKHTTENTYKKLTCSCARWTFTFLRFSTPTFSFTFLCTLVFSIVIIVC